MATESQEVLDIKALWPHGQKKWAVMSAAERDAAVLDALTAGYSLVSVALKLDVQLWTLQLYLTGMPDESGTLRERMRHRLAVSQAAAKIQLDFTMSVLVQQSGAIGRFSSGLKSLTDLFGAPDLHEVQDPESDAAVSGAMATLEKHGWKLGKDFAPPAQSVAQDPDPHKDPDPDPHGS